MHAVEWKQYMSKTWFISNSFIAFWLFQVHSHYIFAIGKNCSKIAKRCVSVSVNVYLAMVKYTYFLPRYTVLFNTTLEPIHNFEWKKIWIKILNECLEWVFVRSFFFGPDVKISWLSLALFSIVTTKVVTMCPPICVHRGYTHAFVFVYACSCSFIR